MFRGGFFVPGQGVNLAWKPSWLWRIIRVGSVCLVLAGTTALLRPAVETAWYRAVKAATPHPIATAATVAPATSFNVTLPRLAIAAVQNFKAGILAQAAAAASQSFSVPSAPLPASAVSATAATADPQTITPAPSATLVNRLIIPGIGVDMPIIDGTDGKSALRQGAWRLPLPGDPTPDKPGSNVVLAGHRWYRLSGPNTLYRLNLVAVGDELILTWNGRTRTYTVREVKIVNADQLEILDPTGETQITLFTCTPLYSSKQRLVVIAR